MDVSRAKVLLILPQETLDSARVLAGKATTTLKLPVSLQIVLRALIEEGLRRGDDPGLLQNVQRQAQAVRDARRAGHHGPVDHSAPTVDGARGSGRDARNAPRGVEPRRTT